MDANQPLNNHNMRVCTDESMADCQDSNLTFEQGQAALDSAQKNEQEIRSIISESVNDLASFDINDVYNLHTSSQLNSEGVGVSTNATILWAIYTSTTGETKAFMQSLLPITFVKVSD